MRKMWGDEEGVQLETFHYAVRFWGTAESNTNKQDAICG